MVLCVEAMLAEKAKVSLGRDRQAELRAQRPCRTSGHIPASGAHTFPLLA